jgi:hypothetical protein
MGKAKCYRGERRYKIALPLSSNAYAQGRIAVGLGAVVGGEKETARGFDNP